MISLRRVAPLPAVAQLLLLLTLLGGIVTMHAVTFTLSHDHDHDAQSTMAAAMPHQPSLDAQADPAPAPCDEDCGHQHTGLHGCVFVMTATAIIVGLAMLWWVGPRSALLIAAKVRRSHRRRQRAPPWTVLSLHQLSILRV